MPWMQKYPVVILFSCVGFLPLLANADMFGWFNPIEASVKKLCSNNAGTQLNKPVTVNGYFDERDGCPSCWLDLVELPVTWVEFCQKNSAKYNLISKAGCWRLSEVSRVNSQSHCHKRLNAALRASNNKAVQGFRGGHCINVEYLEQPTAIVGLGKASSVISYRDNRYKIEEQQVRLFNRNTQQNLASSTTFAYSKKNNSKPQYCESYIDNTQTLSRKELVMQYFQQHKKTAIHRK